MIDWQPILACWSRELMNSELADRVEPPPASPDWLGFVPATPDDIAELERRLGVILPPSYVSFLRTSNGWRRTSAFIDRIRPAEEVNWFRVENEQWAEVYAEHGSDLSDEDYYDYARHAELHYRAEHMRSLIQISDVDDAVLLLNPEVVTPDGEWEAWFFANWVPGARRYPSFAHLMFDSYRSFRRLHKVRGRTPALPSLKAPKANVPRVPAERIRTKTAKAPMLESLLDAMRSADGKARGKAVRTFFGKLRGRPRAQRRPELVQPLADLFYTSRDADVRCACVAALTEIAEDPADADAPRPLLDALSDPDPSVVLQGIFAMHYFPDGRALEPLCRFIESRANVFYNENAMSALRELGDERAVPTLAGVLLDTANTFDQNFGTAGFALAQCGPRGFDVLVKAVDHADARVRFAAVVGLDTSGDPRAAPFLDRLESDPEQRVRDRAKIRMGKMW